MAQAEGTAKLNKTSGCNAETIDIARSTISCHCISGTCAAMAIAVSEHASGKRAFAVVVEEDAKDNDGDANHVVHAHLVLEIEDGEEDEQRALGRVGDALRHGRQETCTKMDT